jgi:hypothetical protein
MKARNRVSLLAILLLLLFTLPSWSQTPPDTWQGTLQERGYTDFSQTKKNGTVVYTATGSAVPTLSFESRDGLSNKTVDLIGNLYGTLSSWQSLTLARVNLSLEGDTLRALIIPSRFVYQGKDLLPHIPGGLFFATAGEEVTYDFRVKSADYFIRFQGQLIDEPSLLNHLSAAIDDPAQYIRNNDPTYLSSRIDGLRDQLVTLTEQNRVLIALLQEKLQEQEGLIKNLSGEQQENRDKIAALRAENQEMGTAKDKIAVASVAALSKGLFSAPKPPSPEVMRQIILLKQQKTDATVAEIGAQLKAQGLNASDKQIKAVFMVYFGEYEK